jgi:tRNA(Ser,Leu) C12 N-acetylase TAN1
MEQQMDEWNLIVCTYQDGYRRARRALRELGWAIRSPYHNVIVLAVDDPMAALEVLEKRAAEHPALYDAISRVVPALHSFDFRSAEEFKEKALTTLLDWSAKLGGKTFHVRFHRRGERHDLTTPEIKHFLDDALLEALRKNGVPGAVSFSDPDAVITIDTIDDRAGLGLWSREDLASHHLLRPD